MKNLFLFIACAALFAGCSKDDDEMSFSINVNVAETEVIPFGTSRSFDVLSSNVANAEITKPEGWSVVLGGSSLTVTAPDRSDAAASEDGTIIVKVTGNGDVVTVSFDVAVYSITTFDFEEFDGSDRLADSAYGSNYYSGADKVTFWSSECGLYSEINDGDYGQAFFSGGIAVSQFNDMTTAGYTNQMSAYYSDPVTSYGGHGGSHTFGVHYGNNNEVYEMDSRTKIMFDDDQRETVFESIWVCNNTYAYLSMHDGDGFVGSPLNATDCDWLKIIITGYDKSGQKTGAVEYYPADFRTASSACIVEGWHEVDLKPLGMVNTLVFDMQGTRDNGYGTALPVYFCMDDISFRNYGE